MDGYVRAAELKLKTCHDAAESMISKYIIVINQAYHYFLLIEKSGLI
jgi:hypothetical protein